MPLFQPSKFSDDWYGWLTNQVSHIGLGVGLVFTGCLLWLVVVGEFPYRLPLWAFVLAGYSAFELIAQGWRGWDTCEDVLFVAFYGAGAPLFAFHEVAPGGSEVRADIALLIPFFYVAAAHLFAGVTHRRAKARRQDRLGQKSFKGMSPTPPGGRNPPGQTGKND